MATHHAPRIAVALTTLCTALFGCMSEEPTGPDDRAVLGIPDHLEVPEVPSFNRPSAEKIALGRRLFYDRRLSGNRTQACASCHEQQRAFSDGRRTPTGSTGQVHRRNSQGLANAAYNSTLTWANNGLVHLEDQLQVPIRGDRPVELGVSDANVGEVLARFDQDPSYTAMFRAAFPESPSGATVEKIIFALATFCRTLVSADSPYDRYVRGDRAALTESQRRGMALFNGERLECFHCHGGYNLTDAVVSAATRIEETPFHNNALYNVDGMGAYPEGNRGLYEITHLPADMGRFRAPTLRNIAVTGPYMHDGSIATLDAVLDHYAAGGRRIASGPTAGDGSASPLRSEFVRGFTLTAQERADVLAFLAALTDETLLHDPRYADPFGVE